MTQADITVLPEPTSYTPDVEKAAAKKIAAKKTAVKKAAPAGEAPIVSFADPQAWVDWLAANHASSRGVWLKLAKKVSGVASFTCAEAIEVALAWGWIDGQKQAHDEPPGSRSSPSAAQGLGRRAPKATRSPECQPETSVAIHP